MELRVKRLYGGGFGRMSLWKLRREAMKRKVNPSVADNSIVVKVSSPSIRRRRSVRVNLEIEYKDPVEIAKAYGHGVGYEALFRELSPKFGWGLPCVDMDVSRNSVFDGKWTLRDRRTDEHCKIGGKTLLWFLVHGDVSRKDELDSYFSKIVESERYSGGKLQYDGWPVIENSWLYLMREVDDISEEEVPTGVALAKKWLKPFLTVGKELSGGVKEVSSIGESFIYESRPSSVEKILVEMPVSLESGRGFIAEYSHKLGD